MKMVISALHFEWQDMSQCLDRAVNDFGLDGVELSWRSSYRRPHCTAADLASLETLMPGRPLELSAHIWENLPELGHDPGVEALLHWLSYSRKTGVRKLVVHGGSWPDRQAGVERTVDILATVAPLYAQGGVTLYLENHYAYDYQDCHELFSEAWEYRELFQAVSEGVGFCFDTGHGHLTDTWRDLFESVGQHLHYVHLADNHGLIDDHEGFGRGTVPWDDMFAGLEDIGFDGTFCVEFPVREDKGPFHDCLSELARRFGR